MAKALPPMHPGEVLREEFLVPMDLSPYALAKICDVPRTRIERIAREEISVTADTALRLSKALGTTAGFSGSTFEPSSILQRRKRRLARRWQKSSQFRGMRLRVRRTRQRSPQ